VVWPVTAMGGGIFVQSIVWPEFQHMQIHFDQIPAEHLIDSSGQRKCSDGKWLCFLELLSGYGSIFSFWHFKLFRKMLNNLKDQISATNANHHDSFTQVTKALDNNDYWMAGFEKLHGHLVIIITCSG
jgi:hypothetical protein